MLRRTKSGVCLHHNLKRRQLSTSGYMNLVFKRVYVVKTNTDGSVKSYKARLLVAGGCHLNFVSDYDTISSSSINRNH